MSITDDRVLVVEVAKTILDSGIRRETKCLVLQVASANKKWLDNPEGLSEVMSTILDQVRAGGPAPGLFGAYKASQRIVRVAYNMNLI